MHAVGGLVGSGGEDHGLAPQIFVSAGDDVVLDGLATGGFVDAKGGVLLGGGVEAAFVKMLGAILFGVTNPLLLCIGKSSVITNLDCAI